MAEAGDEQAPPVVNVARSPGATPRRLAATVEIVRVRGPDAVHLAPNDARQIGLGTVEQMALSAMLYLCLKPPTSPASTSAEQMLAGPTGDDIGPRSKRPPGPRCSPIARTKLWITPARARRGRQRWARWDSDGSLPCPGVQEGAEGRRQPRRLSGGLVERPAPDLHAGRNCLPVQLLRERR